jgi:hypothetical protein
LGLELCGSGGLERSEQKGPRTAHYDVGRTTLVYHSRREATDLLRVSQVAGNVLEAVSSPLAESSGDPDHVSPLSGQYFRDGGPDAA